MSRTRYTDEEKARLIGEFEQHGATAASFCRDHGLIYQTFMNWRRGAKPTLQNPSTSPEFIEFELGAAPHPHPAEQPLVELELGGGMVLRIGSLRPRRP